MGSLSQIATPQGVDSRQAILAKRPRRTPQVRIGMVNRGRSQVHRAHDPSSGRTVDLGPTAARILSCCDGSITIARLIEIETMRLGDAERAARDVLTCLETAQTQGLVRGLQDGYQGRVPAERPNVFLRTLKNPLFARYSLFRPDPLVEALAPLAKLLFNPLGALVWLFAMSCGAWLVFANWDELFAYGKAHALAPSNLLWTILLFPLVKVLHELGHALACKRWGGQVRDFGIALLVFIPIPFVDCSDSAFFKRRRQRIIVASAGMMVEFVIAAIALTLWVAASDPFVRMMAFNVVVMSTITTVVFNANPLLRYDAYYILCDLIGVDNLATRAQSVINTLTRRAFLGDKRPWPVRGARTSALFVTYGTASFIYKTMIVIAVLVGIAPRFFIFGLLLAVWGAATMVIMPIYRQVRSVLAFASGDSRKGVLAGLRIGLPIAILVLVLALPLPYAIVTAGAIQLPPQSVVRAGGDGFLLTLPVGRGATVEAGTPLALLGNDILDAEIESRSASLRAQQLRYDMAVTANLVQAAQLRSEIDVLTAELVQQQSNRERLAATAARPGRFILAENLRIGDFLQEGSEIGLLVPPDTDRVVMTSLTQEDADLLRSRIRSISVRTLGGDQHVHTAQMLRNYPLFAAPQAWAESGLTGRFAFELALTDAPLRYAQPVMVRFDLGQAPLAEQIWRTASIWFNKIAMSRYVEGSIRTADS